MLNTVLGTLSSGVAAATGSYESISSTTLGSDTPSITLSSIPSTYKHLQIRISARTDRGVAATGFCLVINSDTGANYTRHNLYGDGATVTASGTASASNTILGRSLSTTANIFTGYIIDILDYASTSKYKTVRNFSGWDGNGSGAIALSSGLWMSTSAITTLKFEDVGQNLTTGTTVALYGIKGA